MTGAFLGSWTCAQDKLTDREVKPVIIGRLGGSGMSCTNKSTGSDGISLIRQVYSPLSINFKGLNSKLKFFGFSDLWKKDNRRLITWLLFFTNHCQTYPLILLQWFTIYILDYCLTRLPGQFFNFQNRFFTNDTGTGQS